MIEETVAWSNEQRFQRFIGGVAVGDLRSKRPFSTAGMPKAAVGLGNRE